MTEIWMCLPQLKEYPGTSTLWIMRETVIYSYLITSEWLYFAATCSAVTNSPFDEALSGSAPSKQTRTFEWILWHLEVNPWSWKVFCNHSNSPDGDEKLFMTIHLRVWMVTKKVFNHNPTVVNIYIVFGWWEKVFRDHSMCYWCGFLSVHQIFKWILKLMRITSVFFTHHLKLCVPMWWFHTVTHA